MSKQASPYTQTCEIRMKQGRLPDARALQRYLDGWHLGVTLRGIEMTADGQVMEAAHPSGLPLPPARRQNPDLSLRISGTGQIVPLRPLTHKVQWDFKAKCEQPIEDQERAAYLNLLAQWHTQHHRLQITGPLTMDAETGGLVLEVRDYRILPDSEPDTRARHASRPSTGAVAADKRHR